MTKNLVLCKRMLAEDILKSEAEAKNLIYNEVIDKYVGFMNISMLNIRCEVMASNRIMNENVIELRIKENEIYFKKTGKLLDFGTAILVVIRENKDDIFYVADGQHRITTLCRLKKMNLTSELWISVAVKMVDNEIQAKEYLQLFQKQYPPDIRLFSENMMERTKKHYIINLFRSKWPNAFSLYDKREISKINNVSCDNHRIEVERPNLSDGLVCTLYKDIDVFRIGEVSGTLLDELNEYIIDIYKEKRDRLKKVDGCAFGLIRESDIKIIKNINSSFTNLN